MLDVNVNKTDRTVTFYVFNIDYGIQRSIASNGPSKIRPLPEQFAEIPQAAFALSLSGLTMKTNIPQTKIAQIFAFLKRKMAYTLLFLDLDEDNGCLVFGVNYSIASKQAAMSNTCINDELKIAFMDWFY